MADGLTKHFLAVNYVKFIKQLRLKVIKIDWQSIKSVMACINVFVKGHVAKAAKALVVNKPIMIFHAGHRKF